MGHWGAWRAVTAIPAVIASSGVVLVFAGGLGSWVAVVLLSWLASGVLTLTRTGERIVVRLGPGFRRPSPADRALLDPVWTQVIDRAGLDPRSVDLYIQRGTAINAYAVGGRSVAVNTRLLNEWRRGCLDRDAVAAVLAHELGHHETRGARFVLATLWLTMPWRVLYRAVLGVGIRLIGRQAALPLATVVIVTFGAAAIHAGRQSLWGTVVVLSAVAVCALVVPLIDAALSRAGEYAADRFAARVGYGGDLARVLSTLDHGAGREPMIVRRFARHPSPTDRVRNLIASTNPRRQASCGGSGK